MMERRHSHPRPRQKEVIIAVMGMTGVGKSAFIKRVTGSRDIVISSSLDSGTHDVKPYKVAISTPGTQYHDAQSFAITLIDCPGFDDPSVTDAGTINAILTYLRTTYYQGKKLHGIIYMLNITNRRIGGIDRRNFAMFQRLCGVDYYSNVVLGTTHWDQLENISEGEAREKELMRNPEFWGQFANKGSKLRRIGIGGPMDGDTEIVLEIARNHYPRALHAQEEMDQGLTPSETSAAREIDVWNFFFEEQRRMFDELRRRRLDNREKIAKNQVKRKREFEKFEAKLSKEEEERAMQAARDKEEVEFQRKRLAGRLNGDQDFEDEGTRRSRRLQEKRRDKQERGIQQLQEEYMNQRRSLEERAQKEQERKIKKCRRAIKNKRVVCGGTRSGGCGRKINIKREWFYHCCHCEHDNYDHCKECGPYCPKSPSHPEMTRFDLHQRIALGGM